MKLVYSLLFAAFSCVIAVDAQAQLIDWQTSVQMFQGDAADESWISTNGTLVDAVNGGSAIDATVNGVLFEAFPGSGFDANGDPVTGDGHVTTSTAGFITVNDSNTNDGAFQTGEFGAGPVGDLIDSGLWSTNSVTLNNLTVGNTYEIQLINNDARGNRTIDFQAGYGIGDGSGPVGLLQLNNSPLDDPDTGEQVPPTFPETNVGDFLIGTFTADSDSLTFECFGTNSGGTLNPGDSRAQINGLQLRDISGDDCPVGDVNRDGVINFLDIGAFIAVLSSGGFDEKADTNGDGSVNFLDIGGFIALL